MISANEFAFIKFEIITDKELFLAHIMHIIPHLTTLLKKSMNAVLLILTKDQNHSFFGVTFLIVLRYNFY